MNNTTIEWTDLTWNPITGCSEISPGCANCYAKRMAKRLKGRFGYPLDDPFRVTYHEDRINDPFRWIKPKKIFVCSMGDIFHDDVEDWMLDEVFKTILCESLSHLTFIVLTKRSARMLDFCSRGSMPALLEQQKNVWLGVTAENQEQLDRRVVDLLKTEAAVRFVSIEPMIGSIDFSKIPPFDLPGNEAVGRVTHYDAPWDEYVNWVIVGGETGPNARKMYSSWLFFLIDQCRTSKIPIFVKQISGRNSTCRHYPMPDFAKIRMFPGDVWS